ncbi:MAG: hypothetical protein HPY81_02170 [Firmicutes bacterium]|nr:hypothetical protein [Bacillota bacterium]
MSIKVGIPRALFYYYYYPMWKTFFEELGAEVVVSPLTNKKILDQGVGQAVDETCLPVKIFYGHVLALMNQVDYLFVPRLVAMEPKTYICPKFMGLPDMIRANIAGLPPLIDTCVDLSRNNKSFQRELQRIGLIFHRRPAEVMRPYQKSVEQLKRYQAWLRAGWLPEEAIAAMQAGEELTPRQPRSTKRNDQPERTLRVVVLGHGYTVYDDHLNMRLIDRLRSMGVEVVTPDSLPADIIEQESARLRKRMFWTLGKKMIGGAFHFLKAADIHGIIHLTCFGCGPDSLVGELVERHAAREGKMPFMLLTFDEHTGEAGTVTRIEAFIDMIKRRVAQREGYVSAHG